jgi:hypothetical protein
MKLKKNMKGEKGRIESFSKNPLKKKLFISWRFTNTINETIEVNLQNFF